MIVSLWSKSDMVRASRNIFSCARLLKFWEADSSRSRFSCLGFNGLVFISVSNETRPFNSFPLYLSFCLFLALLTLSCTVADDSCSKWLFL